MIVRNAERSLAAALASARPFVDEMVVVDTGSTDGTRQIAEQEGARVFDFPWCDSFSAARNHSLAQATGDWIFWMDADDLLSAESGQELRRKIAECPGRDAAFWVTIEEQKVDKRGRKTLLGHAHAKLFPRREEIRFRYRVHEQVAPSIRQAGLAIRQSRAVVRHAADRSPAAEAARAERNLRLAYLDLQDHPRDPFVWLTLGTTYLFMTDCLPTAIYFLRRSAAGFRRGSAIQLNAMLYLGQALGTSGDRRQEENVYRRALASFPDDSVLLMRLAGLCERSRRSGAAVDLYRRILERGKIRVSAVHGRHTQLRAALRLGQLHLRIGQRQQAETLWRDFLARHPQATPVRRALERSLLNPSPIIVNPPH